MIGIGYQYTMAKLGEYHLVIYNNLPGWNNRSFHPDDF